MERQSFKTFNYVVTEFTTFADNFQYQSASSVSYKIVCIIFSTC